MLWKYDYGDRARDRTTYNEVEENNMRQIRI